MSRKTPVDFVDHGGRKAGIAYDDNGFEVVSK